MFAVGDMVVYGGEGVCRVERVAPPNISGIDNSRLYYTLLPLGRSGQVMTPVDTGVLLRPVMSRDEVEGLLRGLRELPEDPLNFTSPRVQKEYYQQVVTSYDCLRMAALIKAVCLRRKRAVSHGRKVSQLDERYCRRAWDQLVGELAAALGLSFQETEQAVRLHCPEIE